MGMDDLGVVLADQATEASEAGEIEPARPVEAGEVHIGVGVALQRPQLPGGDQVYLPPPSREPVRHVDGHALGPADPKRVHDLEDRPVHGACGRRGRMIRGLSDGVSGV